MIDEKKLIEELEKIFETDEENRSVGGGSMSNDMYRQCRNCCARKECPSAAMPGSVICTIKRLQSGKTHGDEDMKRRCPHCGRLID